MRLSNIRRILSTGLAHSTYSTELQFIFSSLINPVDFFTLQKDSLLTLTTRSKFEGTIKKKKLSPLGSISIEVFGDISYSYHCPGDWLNEKTVPVSSRYGYLKHK